MRSGGTTDRSAVECWVTAELAHRYDRVLEEAMPAELLALVASLPEPR